MFQRHGIKLLAAALLLSACAPVTSNLDQPKRVQVHVNAESYIVKLTRNGKTLRPGEKEELDQYLAHLGDIQDVEFSLRRTHKGMSLASLTPVEKELIKRGADPNKIYRLAEIGVDYQGEWSDVEIIAKQYVAVTPGCPNGSRLDMLGGENANSSDFGCATAAALAMSIADPRDLARGRDLGPASGVNTSAAVQRYDDDKVKELSTQTTETKAAQ